MCGTFVETLFDVRHILINYNSFLFVLTNFDCSGINNILSNYMFVSSKNL